MTIVKNNLFTPNPYYKSAWEQRKEILIKVKELQKIKQKFPAPLTMQGEH